MYQTILSEIRKSINVDLGNDVWKIIYDMLNVKHPISTIIRKYIQHFDVDRCVYCIMHKSDWILIHIDNKPRHALTAHPNYVKLATWHINKNVKTTKFEDYNWD